MTEIMAMTNIATPAKWFGRRRLAVHTCHAPASTPEFSVDVLIMHGSIGLENPIPPTGEGFQGVLIRKRLRWTLVQTASYSLRDR